MHPLWLGPTLSGWLPTFVGGWFSFGGATSPWIWAGQCKKGLSAPIRGQSPNIEDGHWLYLYVCENF